MRLVGSNTWDQYIRLVVLKVTSEIGLCMDGRCGVNRNVGILNFGDAVEIKR